MDANDGLQRKKITNLRSRRGETNNFINKTNDFLDFIIVIYSCCSAAVVIDDDNERLDCGIRCRFLYTQIRTNI